MAALWQSSMPRSPPPWLKLSGILIVYIKKSWFSLKLDNKLNNVDFRERKKKMNGGLATLRRRLLPGGRRGTRGSRSSRSGDRAAPLRDLLKEWSPLEVRC